MHRHTFDHCWIIEIIERIIGSSGVRAGVRTDAFAGLSIRFVQGLPDNRIAQRIAGQYQDCSTSTAANYRAARRARSHDEFIAKLGIVSEEADESAFWLKRLLNAKPERDRRLTGAARRSRTAGQNFRGIPSHGEEAEASMTR
ncbi:MAG: hypothetical protein DMF88_20510 [Acidobacteria bacterium]|nr:MAG: hypothetical protein DMF88_20510 [Acidobacteriota bacterium]